MSLVIAIIFFLGWIVAPIVFLVLFIVKCSESSRLKKQLSEAEQQLKQIKMHNDVLRNRIAQLLPEGEQRTEQMVSQPAQQAEAVQEVAQYAQPVTQIIEGAGAECASTDVVNDYNPAPAATMTEATGAQTYSPQDYGQQNYYQQANNAQAYNQQANNTQAYNQQAYNQQAYYPQAYNKPVENKPVSVGVVLFGIGTFLILLAGAIFATTSWKVLPAGGKIAVLLGAVAVFFAGALVADKKLKLRNTSITFYILGSTFLAVTNLAAGYFGWYGLYWANSDNQLLIWALSALLTAACLIVGAVLYKAKILGILGYDFLALGILLIGLFATDDLFVLLIITGMFLLLSRAYVRFVEYDTDHDPIGMCVDILTYIQNFAVILGLLFYENNIYTEPFEVEGVIVLLSFLVTAINLGNTSWQLAMVLRSDRLKSKMGRKVPAVISASIAIVVIGAADRILSEDIYRMLISIVIYLVIFVVLSVLCQKGKNWTSYRWIAEGYTLGLLLLAVLMSVGDRYYIDKGAMIFVLLIISVVVYLIQHLINKNTVCGFISSLAILTFVMELIRFFELQKTPWLCSLIALTLTAIFTTAGRFIYGKVVSFTEEHKYIDWISIFSSILVIYAIAMAFEGDSIAVQFTVVLVAALYIVTYVGRLNETLDKIMITLAILWASFTCFVQPFFEVPDEFMSEWIAGFLLIATGACAVVWRKYRKFYQYVWMAVIAIAFLAQFVSIIDEYDLDGPIRVVKLVVLIVGMLLLFVVAFMKKSKLFMVETGFVLACSSFMALSIDVKGLFVFMCLMGAAYLLYLQYSGMSLWTFLPVIQIYLVLIIFDVPVWAWIITFIVAIALGVVLHIVWDSGKSLADDWINVSGIIPVIAVFAQDNDKWIFCAEMMLVVYAMSFYKRYRTDSKHIVNKLVLSFATGVSAIAWISQPFVDVPDLLQFEWVAFGFLAFCLINMLAIYKDSTSELWGWITYGVSICCVLIQGIAAIRTGEVADALILGISMLTVLVIAYAFKKKQWFIMAAVTLVLQSIYASRRFWLSIAWWVYLLVAGAVLISIAARSEYRKRTSTPENDTEKRQWFKDWTL